MAIGTTAAILGSAAIGALTSKSASDKAVKASNNATDQTLALQKQQFDQTRQDLSPYAQAGQSGLNDLQGRVTGGGGSYGNTQDPTYQDPGSFSYTADDYTQSPGYQFQLDQGLRTIGASQSARGALNSGATMKAGIKYAQGLAAQDFNQARDFAAGQFASDRAFDRGNYDADRGYLTNRYDQQTGVATNLANIGQSAAAGQANAGQNYAQSAGNAIQGNAANVANAGLVGASNTNSLIGQGLNAYMYNQNGGLVNGLTQNAGLRLPNTALPAGFNPSLVGAGRI